MNEPLTIRTERVDDIPLLLAQMQRMGIVRLLDAHFPTHGNREGLSLGVVIMIWLTRVLSQADHCMNRVQPWATPRLETLRGCSEESLEVRDLADDWLADVLRHLSDDARWRAFEQELTGHLVRVYELHADCVRLDSTTASSYGAVSEDGLLQWGYSKDHRPDLPQLQVMLATLDPLGLPLATAVLSGERVDDPLYLPAIARVLACLKAVGLLYVGDCKMAALDTRASIQAAGDYYLCPLSALQVPPEQLAQQVATLRESSQPLLTVERTGTDGQTHVSRRAMKTARPSRRSWRECPTPGGNDACWCVRRRQRVQRRQPCVPAWGKRRRRWPIWWCGDRANRCRLPERR